MAEEKLNFQAEVSKLLNIVIHSLYSNKEIFLRELISNASDACDKLRYIALTQPDILEKNTEFRIILEPDKTSRILSVSDNGIGMNRDDLIDNLGTIAKSGTEAFLNQLTGEAKKDMGLIGQFGIGFYSAFMVSEKVEVITRKAGEDHGWRWISDGNGEFTIDKEDIPIERGTKILLHLRKDNDEFLDGYRLRTIVKSYSDHITLPVMLIEDDKNEQINSASALWTRPKSEITDEQYKEFYHHIAHAVDEPWSILHYKAEGAIEYTSLLFIPNQKPFDIFHPDRKQHIKFYVKRVFITDDCSELLPSYLRFIRGIVDSQDLPLNVSREMLQHNQMLAKIRTGLIKRVLSELKKKSEDDENNYQIFWKNFGAVLKEGIYEDFERRNEILELSRFVTTASDEPISLNTYLSRMKDGQEAIYTISGDEIESIKKSPQLEGFVAKGIEVLLLTDPIDEFWPGAISSYQEKQFRSVTYCATDLSKIKSNENVDEVKVSEGDMTSLINIFKLILTDHVKDVRSSNRLIDSPVCLVAEDGDVGLHLERILRQHTQTADKKRALRILEINPSHPLIRRLADSATSDDAINKLTDSAWLLFDQARIIEGEVLSDPMSFANRLSKILEKIS
ncbi:MAG: molecular chaperone HtpG [Rhodospirillaceae bacterium]|jgi:molecular chaperone HtpG|nr:molecular chaperone HtpG [Rhodospirillaceae bacterium]